MSSLPSVDTARSNTAFNLRIMVVESSIFMMGVAFMDMNTLFPQFLKTMGASALLIGIIQGLRQFMFFVPYPYAIGMIRGKPLVKGYLLKACIWGRTPLIMAAGLLWLQPENHTLAIIAGTLAIIMFTFGDGFGCLPWYELVGRLIPSRSRGRFFGGMQTLGALSALAASLVVPKIMRLTQLNETHRYALLFGCMGLLLAVSTYLITVIRESYQHFSEDDNDQPQGFMEQIRHVPVCWKRDQSLRRLIYTQLLITGEGLSMSFYGLYAIDKYHLPADWMAYFVTASATGAVVTGPLWGLVADRMGAVKSLKMMVPLAIIAPAIALVSWSPVAFLVVFASIGSVVFGVWACMTNTALAIAPKIDRPTYIALQQLSNFPLSITPIIGGWVIQNHGYIPVFILTLICVTAGAVLAQRIPKQAAVA